MFERFGRFVLFRGFSLRYGKNTVIHSLFQRGRKAGLADRQNNQRFQLNPGGGSQSQGILGRQVQGFVAEQR